MGRLELMELSDSFEFKLKFKVCFYLNDPRAPPFRHAASSSLKGERGLQTAWALGLWHDFFELIGTSAHNIHAVAAVAGRRRRRAAGGTQS